MNQLDRSGGYFDVKFAFGQEVNFLVVEGKTRNRLRRLRANNGLLETIRWVAEERSPQTWTPADGGAHSSRKLPLLRAYPAGGECETLVP
jgi:hypothetical protein